MYTRAGILVVVLAALAVTTPASPVQLSYVYSDSMEPTIGQNDGYIVVPAQQVQQRDIIVFWSQEREEYVTHRIVGRSDEGLITQGDNNDVTDQAAGHPYVQRSAITGTVLSLTGEPVTIDGLGVLVSLVHSQRLLILGIAMSLIGGSILFGGSQQPHPRRSLLRVRDVIHPVFAAAIIGGTMVILIGAVSHELMYVAIDGGSSAQNTLTVGSATTETISINASALPLTHRLVSTDGMTITNSTRNASTITANVHIPGPTTSGAYQTSIAVYRYPAVLPFRLVETIHAIHPAVAAGATMSILFSPFVLAYALLFDGNTPLRTSQTRWQQRLWRRIR